MLSGAEFGITFVSTMEMQWLSIILIVCGCTVLTCASFINSPILTEPGEIQEVSSRIFNDCRLNRTALLTSLSARMAPCNNTLISLDSFLRLSGCESTAALSYTGCLMTFDEGKKIVDYEDSLINERVHCFDSCMTMRCISGGLDFVTDPFC